MTHRGAANDRAGGPLADGRGRLALGAVAFVQAGDASVVGALERQIVAAGGRSLQQLGDQLIVWFDSASVCVAALAKLAATDVRAGASAGDVSIENELLHGLPVIEASRLKDLAAVGEIVCTLRLVRLARLPSAAWSDSGKVRIKGIEEPVHIARLI